MRLGHDRCCLTLAVWALCALASTVLAQTTTPKTLRSMREVGENLRNGETEIPIDLEATVTNYCRIKRKLFVQDEGMALFVAVPQNLYEEDAPAIGKGSRVRIRGSAMCEECILRATSVEALGEKVAIKPLDVESLTAGTYWSKLVRFEGEVTALLTVHNVIRFNVCLLYTSPSPRDATLSRMPSSA